MRARRYQDGVPAAGAAHRFRLLVLGPFALYVDDVPLDTGRWSRSCSALLKLLATAPHWRRSRDELMDILWPEAAPGAAASNLRTTLHLLRRALGGGDPSPVLFGRGWLELNCAYEWDVDLDRFIEGLRVCGDNIGHVEETLALFRGEPLPEHRYDDWARDVRERAQTLWRGAILKLAALYEDAGDVDAAIERLDWLLQAEPLDEEVLQTQLRILVRGGKRNRAFRRYREFERRLQEELGLVPEDATRALLDPLPSHPPSGTATERRGHRANLPAEVTSFVGRDRELSLARQLLELGRARLLTLTGTGGCGKTRLSREVARELLATYRDGVMLVSLAPLDDPSLLEEKVASTLGVREEQGTEIGDTLKSYLKTQRILLILDNLEHLVPHASLVVSGLLSACPELAILATSRAPLRVYGEHVLVVPPLALPQSWTRTTTEDVRAVDSVILFRDRARAVCPDFEVTDENAGEVVEICALLSGLPLALELAASRMATLSPAELLAQLSRPLAVLTAGPIDVAARQQTLRGTIEWSCALLDPDEQTLFNRLSVFRGGCTAEAASRVCAAPSEDIERVRARLTGLVEKSLLQTGGDSGGEPRFTMLLTVRECAHERLDRSGHGEATLRLHAEYFRSLARMAEPELRGARSELWRNRLEADHDNFRAALDWACRHNQAEIALDFASSLSRFWQLRGHLQEGRTWLERALALSGGSDVARARATLGVVMLAFWQGDNRAAVLFGEESLGLYRRQKDTQGAALALFYLGSTAFNQGEMDRAYRHLCESLPLFREVGDVRGTANVLHNVGNIVQLRRELKAAEELFRESLELRRQIGDRRGIALALLNLGGVLAELGDLKTARRHHEDALELCRSICDSQGVAGALMMLAVDAVFAEEYERGIALSRECLDRYRAMEVRVYLPQVLHTLGVALREHGDIAEAGTAFDEGLKHSNDMGATHVLVLNLEGVASVRARQGNERVAAQLFGAAHTLSLQVRMPKADVLAELDARHIAAARVRLGEEAWNVEWHAGKAMSVDEAVRCALG